MTYNQPIAALREAGYITLAEATALLNCQGLTRQRRQQILTNAGIKSIRLDIVLEADIRSSSRYIREDAKKRG